MTALDESIVSSPAAGQSKSQDMDAFHALVQDLSAVLGPSSGIDSHDVDPKELENIMKKYVSNPLEWQQYAHGDGSRNYTRNLVDKGNGKSNLYEVASA